MRIPGHHKAELVPKPRVEEKPGCLLTGLHRGAPRKKAPTALALTKMKSSHPPSDGFLPSKMVTHCQCGWQPGSVFAGPPACMNSAQNEGSFSISHHALTRPARAKWTVFPMPSNPTALPQARRPKEEKASSAFPGDLPFFPQDL